MEKQRTPYSQDGYIVDQARLTGIRYGVFTSDINGCGWIAAYNFLKTQGQPVQEQALADELIRYSVARGLMGTNVFRLKRVLRNYGYQTKFTIRRNKKPRLPEATDAGVILYIHKDGPHYVTFSRLQSVIPERDEAGVVRFRFFNGIGGKSDHFDTLRGFLTKHNVIPLAIILVWPQKASILPSENPAKPD